jgi:hypothetical protein
MAKDAGPSASGVPTRDQHLAAVVDAAEARVRAQRRGPDADEAPETVEQRAGDASELV